MSTRPPRERFRSWPEAALLFGSGFTALVYQVLWVRELALLFGSTALSTATTLAAFFLGLAAGSWVWGRRATADPRPLRTYGRLELGVGVAALACLGVRHVYGWLYPLLRHGLEAPAAIAAVKLVVSLALLAPTAFLIGGTLPAMAQHVIRRRDALAPTGALLYGASTAGGALGAVAAGFVLPPWLGYRRAYGTAVALSVLLGAAALALARARTSQRRRQPSDDRPDTPDGGRRLSRHETLALAAASGVLTLALEVVWTRMLAQVLQGSVYTFAAVLATFLTLLAGGAALAATIARRARDPIHALCVVLTAAGIAAGTSHLVLAATTAGLQPIAADLGWGRYVARVFATTLGVLALPGVLVGTTLPLLLRLDGGARGAGDTVGRLVAVNTVAGVAGALGAGFVGLAALGVGGSLVAIGGAYLALATAVALRHARTTWPRALPIAALLLAGASADVLRLPVVRTLAGAEDQPAVLAVREGRDATVAVLEVAGERRIVVDGQYTLGGTGARLAEETQAELPLALHAAPRRVFVLGLGTGITAAAVLRPDVERLVVAEHNRDVVTLARRYFARTTGSLFTDPRATIVVDDGRHHLFAVAEQFDIVIADLFLPWRAGAGALYAREHFEVVRARLAPGGLFVQWLPLFQLSTAETGTIIHTLLTVFPQVTVWRGNFAGEPGAAVVARTTTAPLDPTVVAARCHGRAGDDARDTPATLGLAGAFYLGNPGALRPTFARYPVNTDDRPIIEYGSPVSDRRRRAGGAQALRGDALIAWTRALRTALPVARDPYLARLGPADLAIVDAGTRLVEATTAADERRRARARARLAATPFPLTHPPSWIAWRRVARVCAR